jgi:hypothetical protein
MRERAVAIALLSFDSRSRTRFCKTGDRLYE